MWWINKNGAIEGPLSSEQIEKRIKFNMLRSLDRVSQDKKQWFYVKDTNFWMPAKPGVKPTPISRQSDAKTEPTIPEHLRLKVPATKPPRDKRLVTALSAIVVVLLAGLGSMVFVVGTTSDSLSSAYNEKQRAVGLVTITFQSKDGNLGTVPIGTAFAISKNRFVTNAHVAYGLKNGFEEQLVTPILSRYFSDKARKQGKSVESYLHEIGMSGLEQTRSEILAFLKEERGVKVRDIEIRLNHSKGKSFRVAKVQVHPRYNPAEENKSGEFDVAIFEIDGSTDCYFDVATKKELYSLRPGIQVASAGFPTEGLDDLNVEKPEASYATGDIKKVTDFDNKDAGAEYNRSIFHSVPAAGGASGSPIFTANGKVIAVLWGGSNHGIDAYGARISSAVLLNFAVRIDQIDDVGLAVTWKDWVNAPTH